MRSQILASGAGWLVRDVVCTAGPHERPFEEQHESVCIAAVTRGTFQYRSSQGAAVLAPGALLLGNHGACFECSHEHAVGDRCISFHFAPDHFEEIVSAAGARRALFAAPRLPPLPALTPLIAAAEAARERRAANEFEELSPRFAGEVIAALAGGVRTERRPSRRDEKRITEAARRIEAQSDAPLTLVDLAGEAAMSRYHFLRTFRQVVGMTPHRFILRTRLHRAAIRLRASDEAVSAIAFDAGFDDLSTFNRRFRRIVGLTPSEYRRARRLGSGGSKGRKPGDQEHRESCGAEPVLRG